VSVLSLRHKAAVCDDGRSTRRGLPTCATYGWAPHWRQWGIKVPKRLDVPALHPTLSLKWGCRCPGQLPECLSTPFQRFSSQRRRRDRWSGLRSVQARYARSARASTPRTSPTRRNRSSSGTSGRWSRAWSRAPSSLTAPPSTRDDALDCRRGACAALSGCPGGPRCTLRRQRPGPHIRRRGRGAGPLFASDPPRLRSRGRGRSSAPAARRNSSCLPSRVRTARRSNRCCAGWISLRIAI